MAVFLLTRPFNLAVDPPSWSWATIPTPMMSAWTMFCTAVDWVKVCTSWLS